MQDNKKEAVQSLSCLVCPRMYVCVCMHVYWSYSTHEFIHMHTFMRTLNNSIFGGASAGCAASLGVYMQI